MMSSISSLTPSGTASARSAAGGVTGDPMASAFAMLFALMPGMGDAPGSDSAEGSTKSDGDTAKDGSATEKGGKDVPSDAAALPVMPFAIPTVTLAPPEPIASPVTASGASPAPITTLLAAMPTLPDAGPAPTTAAVATATATDAIKTPVAAGQPITFDPLKAAMPVPSAMTTPVKDDGVPKQLVTTKPAASPTMTMPDVPMATPSYATPANASSVAPSTTRLDPVAMMPDDTAPGTEAMTVQTTPVPAIPRDAVPNIPVSTPLVATQAQAFAPPVARDTAPPVPTSRAPEATAPLTEQVVRTAAPGIPLAIRSDALPTPLPIENTPIAPASDTPRPVFARPDTPLRFAVANGSTPVVAPLPIQAPAPIIQAGQSASAIQLFGTAMRGEQSFDPRADRRKDDATLSVDPATLTRADSLTAAPVVATTGADQAPLDMTQHHWPQGMIDRIDRMREDAATADTRIQLSPDALGGIAVNLRHEDGATHIHFTADQAQTASLLADAQPTLARLAEEKGMRLGQTAVDMDQSGMGGERQAPPRRPDPVMPTRPAFAGTTASSDAGDPAAASTRIA
ncbi:flagellar hook-length control protein FliK [Sphingomonas sp. Xoc002]|uniref:flagellar hook-length control protein FliK n=1 Tax=Sphingomonas sp. Xoc002 TaxID=2837624 RepID=UPI003D17D71B